MANVSSQLSIQGHVMHTKMSNPMFVLYYIVINKEPEDLRNWEIFPLVFSNNKTDAVFAQSPIYLFSLFSL